MVLVVCLGGFDGFWVVGWFDSFGSSYAWVVLMVLVVCLGGFEGFGSMLGWF